MGSYWLRLDGAGASAGEVGSKAAALDRLMAIGAPVPQAAALTVAAYEDFVSSADLDSLLDRIRHDRDRSALEDGARRVERAFVETGLSPELADAVRAAFDYASGGNRVSVRSSATAEDLPQASFAGQYRTLLDVDADGVCEAVLRCWASLWGAGARAYRLRQGLNAADATMGIVIQKMVDADHSGVAFTVDPTRLDRGLMRIEVVRGLGEGLVSGELTPDVYHVRRKGSDILEDNAPQFVSAVTRAALDIERAFDSPQDIEWSTAGGDLYVLQTRPITGAGGDGFDSDLVPDATYTSAGIAEMLPGPLPPLLWTINAPLLNGAFDELFGELGVDVGKRHMLSRFRGRPALNLSLLRDGANRMPGGSAAEVERQYLGRALSGDDDDRQGLISRIRKVAPAMKALRVRRRLMRDAAAFREAVDLALNLDADRNSLPTEQLLDYRKRLRDLARFGVKTEIATAATAAANYRALEMALERWLDAKEAPAAVQRLTAGGVGTEAAGCAAALTLWGAQCRYCEERPVEKAIYEGDPEDVEERLAALGPEGTTFLDVIDASLGNAGSAAVYAGRTWNEDRPHLWAMLRQCKELGISTTPRELMRHSAETAGRALEEIEERIVRTWRWRLTRVLTGQIIDVRRRLFKRMLSDAIVFLRLREQTKAAVLRLGGEERRVILVLASRLLDNGDIAAPGDEFFLSDDEFVAAARREMRPDLDEIKRRKAAFHRFRAAPELPDVFEGFPGDPTETDLDEAGDVLTGWATSPGRASGRARVAVDLAEARELRRGEILVGRSTNPSWTPLFMNAGAIVMEGGGPLSHAAIVAREFGVPAVLAVKGATRRIRTGTRVTVDGGTGIVEIEEEP